MENQLLFLKTMFGVGVSVCGNRHRLMHLPDQKISHTIDISVTQFPKMAFTSKHFFDIKIARE